MTLPIRLDYVKQIVRDVVASGAPELAAGQFLWVRQGIPRPARPYMSMQILSGPFSDSTREERRFREVIDSSTFTISSAVSGERYRLRVNGFPIDYTATGIDTVTTIRDALLTESANAANYVTGETVSFAANAADAIDVTPDSPGDLALASSPNSTVTVASVKTDAWVTYTVARNLMTVQVTAYDSETFDESATSAKMLCIRAVKVLDTPDTEVLTQNARIGIRRISNITDLSGLEPGGAKLQGQSQFDLEVTASSIVITEVNPIDSVETTLDISGIQENFTTP